MVKIIHTSWLEQKEFIHWDDESEKFIVDDDAPKEVKENYRLYLEEMKYWQKREEETDANII